MAGKNCEKDVATTLTQIQSYWPDFPVVKEDITKPVSDFVVRFLLNFVAEINDQLSVLINEEVGNEPDENQEMDEKVRLYCQASKIYRKINYNAFKLNDLYEPQPKRIHALLKCSIHFLIFVNNSLDEMSNLWNVSYKKFTDAKSLQILKQQCLQDSGENSENIARSIGTNEVLKAKLDPIQTRHKEMLKDKVVKEKISCQKIAERNGLQSENDNIDYELQHLEDKERNLQECLITEEDYENLKKIEKYLELEHEQISNEKCDGDVDTKKKIEMKKYLEEYAETLANQHLDSSAVAEVQELGEEATMNETTEKKIKDEEKLLNEIILNEASIVNKQNLKENEYSELRNKITTDIESEKKLREAKIARYVANFEEYQKLKTETDNEQEEICKIDNDSHTLKETVAVVYNRMLSGNKNVADKFSTTLYYLKNLE